MFDTFLFRFKVDGPGPNLNSVPNLRANRSAKPIFKYKSAEIRNSVRQPTKKKRQVTRLIAEIDAGRTIYEHIYNLVEIFGFLAKISEYFRYGSVKSVEKKK